MVIAEWEYVAPKQGGIPDWAWRLGAPLIVFVVLGFMGPSRFVLILLVIAVAVGMVIRVCRHKQNKLLVSSRYLIAGTEIVYFGNVTKLCCKEDALQIWHLNQKCFTLEVAGFSTKARKPEKVARYKSEKFRKASEKVIRQIHLAVPGVEVINERGAHR